MPRRIAPGHKTASDIAQAAVEQDHREAFISERIREGAVLPGTSPPNDATKAAYET